MRRGNLLIVLPYKGTASPCWEPGPLHIFAAAAGPVLSQSCALKARIPACCDNRPEFGNALENLTRWLFNEASEETVNIWIQAFCGSPRTTEGRRFLSATVTR